MTKGYNKVNPWGNIKWNLEEKQVKDRPCVFLSHKREDKADCRISVIIFAEIDYYLHEQDTTLQQAAATEDPLKIT